MTGKPIRPYGQNKRVVTSLRMTPEFDAKLREVVSRAGVSMSDWITQAIEERLSREGEPS